jgi:hypothetical protein
MAQRKPFQSDSDLFFLGDIGRGGKQFSNREVLLRKKDGGKTPIRMYSGGRWL